LQAYEKALAYASAQLHGTVSRKIQKGVTWQFNEKVSYDDADLLNSDFS
jgi:hypothetical protein